MFYCAYCRGYYWEEKKIAFFVTSLMAIKEGWVCNARSFNDICLSCSINFQVHAVLLLLGGCELSSGSQGVDMALQNQRVVPLSMWFALVMSFLCFPQ